MKMLLARIECEKTTVERLLEILLATTGRFKIWLHNKRVYASFYVRSLSLLKGLIRTLEANKVKFRFYRIEEITYAERTQKNFDRRYG